MSKTYKKEFTKKLLRNGQKGHHNTLLKEFHGKSLMSGIWLVKDTHNLFDERDYQSDRMKGIRKIAGKKRRQYMKIFTNNIIDSEIYENHI
jgi:hypothetical protein